MQANAEYTGQCSITSGNLVNFSRREDEGMAKVSDGAEVTEDVAGSVGTASGRTMELRFEH